MNGQLELESLEDFRRIGAAERVDDQLESLEDFRKATGTVPAKPGLLERAGRAIADVFAPTPVPPGVRTELDMGGAAAPNQAEAPPTPAPPVERAPAPVAPPRRRWTTGQVYVEPPNQEPFAPRTPIPGQTFPLGEAMGGRGPLTDLVDDAARAAVHGFRSGAPGHLARAIIGGMQAVGLPVDTPGAIEEIDRNDPFQRIISLIAGLGTELPILGLGQQAVAAVGARITGLGTMLFDAYGRYAMALGFSERAAAELAWKGLEATERSMRYAGALGAQAGAREGAKQLEAGRIEPGKVVKEAGIGAAAGAIGGAAGIVVPANVLRPLAEIAGVTTAHSLLKDGKLPTVQDLVDAGITLGAIHFAGKMAGVNLFKDLGGQERTVVSAAAGPEPMLPAPREGGAARPAAEAPKPLTQPEQPAGEARPVEPAGGPLAPAAAAPGAPIVPRSSDPVIDRLTDAMAAQTDAITRGASAGEDTAPPAASARGLLDRAERFRGYILRQHQGAPGDVPATITSLDRAVTALRSAVERAGMQPAAVTPAVTVEPAAPEGASATPPPAAEPAGGASVEPPPGTERAPSRAGSSAVVSTGTRQVGVRFPSFEVKTLFDLPAVLEGLRPQQAAGIAELLDATLDVELRPGEIVPIANAYRQAIQDAVRSAPNDATEIDAPALEDVIAKHRGEGEAARPAETRPTTAGGMIRSTPAPPVAREDDDQPTGGPVSEAPSAAFDEEGKTVEPGEREFRLPPDLAGAKPRFNDRDKAFDLQFSRDLDRALYIVAQDVRSRADQRYLDALRAHTGLDEAQLRAIGRSVRSGIRALARSAAPGVLSVPASAAVDAALAGSHVEQMATGAAGRPTSGPAGSPASGSSVSSPSSRGGGYVDLKRKDVLIQELGEALRRAGAGGLVLQGGLRGPAGLHGQRNRLTGNVRMRRITDVDTAAHEIGHGLQHALTISLNNLLAFKREMKALVALQGVKGPAMTEGFAEFVRLYATDPTQARSVATTFHPWFAARLSTEPDLEAALHAFRDGVLALRAAPPRERVRRGLAFEEPRTLGERATEAVTTAPPRFAKAMDSLLQSMFDQYRAIDMLARAIDPAKALPADRDPYKLATTASARAIGVARAFIEDGPVRYGSLTPVGAESYVDIIRAVWKDEQHYSVYEVLRRIQSFERDIDQPRHLSAAAHLRTLFDMERPPTGPDPVAETVDELERDYPNFRPTLDKLQVYNEHLLQYAADSGRYSQRAVDAMRESSEVYVPLHRLMDPEGSKAGAPRGGRGFANTGSLRRLIGKSERIVLPTLTERYKQTLALISAVERNDVVAQLADLLSSPAWAGGKQLGTWMDKVPAPLAVTRFPLDAIKSTLSKALTDAGWPSALLDTIDLGTVATVYQQSIGNLPPGHVLIWRDGAAEVWHVHEPLLLRALTQLDKFQVEPFMQGLYGIARIFGGAASLFRGGVVLNPDFLIAANIPRDQQAAVIQGRGIIPPYFRGFTSAFRELVGATDSELKRAYEVGGGDVFAHGAYDERAVRRMLALELEGGRAHPFRWARQKMGQLVNLSDNPTRYGIAGIALARPRPQDVGERARTIQAAFEGRQGTIDWGMRGGAPFIQAWAMTAAFMRPSLNVLYKAGKTYAEAIRAVGGGGAGQGGGGGRGGTTPPTGPSVGGGWRGPNWRNPTLRRLLIAAGVIWFIETLLWLWQHEDPRYEDQTMVDKALYWTFIPRPIARTEWERMTADQRLDVGRAYKVVKEPLHGFLFGTLWRLTYDAWAKADPVGGAARIAKGIGVVLGVGVIPTLVRPPMELWAGQDLFFDRPIIPRRQEGLLSEQQFGPFTSEVAKSLGQTGAAKVLGLSPFEIDHIVRGYFGTLGQYGTAGIDALTGLLDGSRPSAPEWRLADYPILRRLIVKYPHTRAQSIEDFYELRRRSTEAMQSLRDAAKRQDQPAQARIRRDYGFEITMYGLLEGTALALSATKRRMDEARADKLLLPGPKRDAIERITLEELDRVSSVMESVRAARKRYDEERAPGTGRRMAPAASR